MLRRNWLVGIMGLSLVLLAGPITARAADLTSPIGVWRTIDDKTNQPRALVQIFQQNGLLFGKVTAILQSQFAHAMCQHCSGDRQNQPVLGLEIVRDMRQVGTHWGGGTILNPEDGEVYRCRMHLGTGGETLVVRGFIGTPMLGRTQTWQRMPQG